MISGIVFVRTRPATSAMCAWLWLFVSILFASPSLGQKAPAKYVILISIDGLRPEFYLDESWPAPFLQNMVTQGIAASRVEGIFPTLTYPSHTTIVTGVLPDHHGIFHNTPFEADGTTGLRYWAYDSVRTESIWSLARKAGLTTASIHWPVTVGAPIDYNIPEVWPLDPSVSRREFLGSLSTPSGIFEELEREATGKFIDYNGDGPTEWWRYRFLDSRATDAAAYLLARYRPNLLTLHLLGVDDAAHEGMNSQALREAVAEVDAAVSYIAGSVRALGIEDSTAIVVVGDHGFVQTDTLLAPNVWLVEAGLRPTTRKGDNWDATFHATGGSCFLYLRHTDDSTAFREVQTVLNDLPHEVKAKFRILSHSELVALGADGSAVLALAAKPGTAFTSTTDGPAIRAGSGATHGHLPDETPSIYTGLLAQGAGIPRETSLGSIQLTDIATLVVQLLGLNDMSKGPGAFDGLIKRPVSHE